MTRKSPIVGALAVTAALVVAGAAVAEPSHTTKPLGNGLYTEKWEGTGSGGLGTQDAMDQAGCQPGIHECHDTLIQVLEPGTLTVKTSNGPTPPWTPANDTDLQLFASDASGAVKEELQESAQATPTSEEQVSVRVKAGFYIARIDFAICAQCTVPAEATLKPSGAPAAPTGPGTAPTAADAPPAATAKKPRSKNVKAFSGTASDDKGVAKVEVGVLQMGKRGKCKALTSSGKLVAHKGECSQPTRFITAKGTTKWSLKIRRKLPKGKYVLFVRATDTAGQTQGGFGAANKKAFTVKK